jgi:hypothetical protein
MLRLKFLCFLVLGVAQDVCEVSDAAELGKCLKCCPDVVCPAAPPCPKVDCGTTEEEEEEVPEQNTVKGPVEYRVIAWISIGLTFIPLIIVWVVDKMNLPMFRKPVEE